MSVPPLIRDLLAELRAKGGDVQMIETHVSWVLLGGEVFKIKKPVALPFLDFRSFEAREAACRKEVVVNRRLAPKTYLGVVPIRRGAQGHTFRPEGAVVEWAVRMRRLEDAKRADVLLAVDGLTPRHVDAMATRIAAFHASCARGPKIDRAATVDAIERNVLDNVEALDALDVQTITPGELREVLAWQIAFVRGRRALFEKRIADARIVDGHGDLRLEHVFFTDGDAFDVIDGIEFDARYRYADACADVAFLTMDLRRLGRVDLAERLLATYVRTTNDFDAFRVVDFYESYRAMVRAKVAAFCAAHPDTQEDARTQALGMVRRDLLLALSAGHRPLMHPIVVAVAGGIASGKSTVASALGDALGAPVVEADRVRKHLLGVSPTTHADVSAWTGPYAPAFSEQVYARVLDDAEAVLASGRSVVVDASFRTQAAREQARALAERFSVPFRLLECVAPRRACLERLTTRDRTRSASDGRAEVFDAFEAGFEPITELSPVEHVRIDTSGAPDGAIAAATAVAGAWPQRLVG